MTIYVPVKLPKVGSRYLHVLPPSKKKDFSLFFLFRIPYT